MAQLSLKRQKGVALVQVIITTAIIMLLMIYYMTAAKSQVQRAQALQDKTSAYIKFYNAKNKALYTLLTGDHQDLRGRGWNFHGKPMQIDEQTSVAVQDLNGLLSLATMTRESALEGALANVIEPQQATIIAQSVLDWVDSNHFSLPYGAEQNHYQALGITPRNGPIQSYSELAFINGMTYEAEQVILKNATIHPTPFFNPMTAPVDILAAFSDGERASSAIASRGNGGYNRDLVETATGIVEDEGIAFFSGPGFRLTVSAKVGESYFGKVLEYAVHPYREFPLQVLSRMPRQQLIANDEDSVK